MQTLKLEKKENYAIVFLNRPKVNAINALMVTELAALFKELENDDAVKGVILTGRPGFFSAGLDVVALYQYNKEEIFSFFKGFGSLYLQLAFFRKPLIAALSGYSPAGGTVLAITADSRIMAKGDRYTVGLNEVAVNIQISDNIIEGYAFWIGHGLAHRYILEGRLLKGKQALEVGLIDTLVDEDQLLGAAEERMIQFLKADQEILINTKQKLRKSWLGKLETNPEADFKELLQLWWKPEIRARMAAFVNALKNKKK